MEYVFFYLFQSHFFIEPTSHVQTNTVTKRKLRFLNFPLCFSRVKATSNAQTLEFLQKKYFHDLFQKLLLPFPESWHACIGFNVRHVQKITQVHAL